MRFTSSAIAVLLGSACAVDAYNYDSQRSLHQYARKPKKNIRAPIQDDINSSSSNPQYLNAKSKQFVVNGNKIPNVNFDVGESYAGHLSIDSNATNENALFFWFFPSQNPDASDEITIWLNGGPGCSSLDGFLQENGPIQWQSGTYEPVRNTYSWTNLTNMVWVDQPIGTGLSSYTKDGPPSVVNEEVVARDFMGFWKNFVDTFDLNGRKVYIAGESYAGQYVPYIAWYMLMANNTEYFNVNGIQINDPSIGNGIVLTEAPAVQHLNAYANIFNLNQTFMDYINMKNVECGYQSFMEQALTFPPQANYPKVPDARKPGCNVWGEIITAALYTNPCFNIYHLIDFCPYLSDEMGFPSLGIGPDNYFNRTDVQQALNIKKMVNYAVCGDPTLGLNEHGDKSPPSAFLPLPHVIEMTNNVIIGSGSLDYLLLTNGTMATIQNMTWNGKRGFQSQPSSNFYVPYHSGFGEIFYEINNDPVPHVPITSPAGSGYLGITHYERGLTWVETYHSGHEIPQYQPGAAYRQLEKLLGRISSLTQTGCFTTQEGQC